MQNDDNSPMLNDPEVTAGAPTAGARPILSASREKVIQPSESLIQELQAQPVVPAPQPIQPQPPRQPAPVQPGPAGQNGQMPAGMSASQPGLKDSSKSGFTKKRLLKRLLITLGLLVILGGGGLLAKNLLSPLSNKTLANDGYTYTFKYYKAAKPVTLNDGRGAYKYLNSSLAGLTVTTTPLVTDCSQIGTSWTEAFTVEILGAEQPVCTANAGGLQDYTVIFPALSKYHLFIVTFSNDDPQSPPYSTLKTIFSSVTVAQ